MNQSKNRRSEDKFRIAAIGDLHCHEQRPSQYADLFKQISEQADVLLLCGDLTNLGLPAEAENLAKDLSSCSIPVLGVFGNHDHHSDRLDEIKKILTRAKLILLEDETFVIGDIGFAGVKGFAGGFASHMVSHFGEKAMKDFVNEAVNEALRLENALKSLDTKHKIVALHYSPIAETVKGEPVEVFPFLGSSRFEEIIDRFPEIRAVFHGHAHHGSAQSQTGKKIPVFNCCIEVLKKLNPDMPYALFEIAKEG